MTSLHRLTLVAVLALLSCFLFVEGSQSARAATPIGPNQSFVGQVNGQHTDAVIKVACAGPSGPGRTGPAVSGQTVSVSPSAALAGPGFTGSRGRRVAVRFSDDPSARVVLSSYDTPAPLPAHLQVPCSGTGFVTFTPQPTSPTAQPDVVKVTYENIAA